MPRPKSQSPSYRLHRPSGQAVVTLDGRDHYLGAFDSPASRVAYHEKILAWIKKAPQAAVGAPQTAAAPSPTLQPAPAPAAPAPPQATILDVVEKFWEIVEDEREPLYVKNGKPTSERRNYVLALRVLVRMFGDMPASEFGPLDLRAVREELAKPQKAKTKTKLARSSVNSYVRRIQNVFRIAAEFELITEETHQQLTKLRMLRKGKCQFVTERPKIRPIDRATVDATIPHLKCDVAAMVELQWWTGCRPGEALQLRTGDLDRSDPTAWLYVPQSHKTEHHDKERLIHLGPRAVEVLSPWLKADPKAFVFPMASRPFCVAVYDHAIKKACKAAGLPRWTPNQLRHACATRIRKEVSLEAAQVVLGHSHSSTTEIYAERDFDLARQVARKHG